MSEDTSRAETIETIREMIEDIRIAMLTTVNPVDGSLHSRPMGVAGEMEADNSLWFFTHETARKVTEAEQHPQVGVTFSDPEDSDYVALSGRSRIVTDKAEIEKRWNPALKGWFPEGPETPDLALLHFTPERAEYWAGTDNPLKRAFEFSKAALTGDTPDLGENEKVRL